MKVVILCGGKGTRAYPYTEYLPKPMLPVAGQPILLHVMRIYAAQGFNEFVLSLGYRKEIIMDYFHAKKLDWSVEFADTGEESDTADRIRKLKHMLGDRFMATYADGLANIRINDLLAYHQGHGGLATVTSVQPRSQYGVFKLDAAGAVQGFEEKPLLHNHWINAGFFVFESRVFDAWEGTNLEKHVLPALVKRRQVNAYRHDGFFKSMDTYKDQQEIEQLYRDGEIPWSMDAIRAPVAQVV